MKIFQSFRFVKSQRTIWIYLLFQLFWYFFSIIIENRVDIVLQSRHCDSKRHIVIHNYHDACIRIKKHWFEIMFIRLFIVIVNITQRFIWIQTCENFCRVNFNTNVNTFDFRLIQSDFFWFNSHVNFRKKIYEQVMFLLSYCSCKHEICSKISKISNIVSQSSWWHSSRLTFIFASVELITRS